MGNKTIEQRVAETILQKPEEITVGSKTYRVAPPSTATLILASEAVSRFPQLTLDKERVMEDTLANARHCGIIGDILAILILGGKAVREDSERPRKRWLRLQRREGRKERLARELLEELSPHELQALAVRLLQGIQVSDFFGLTTFLNTINQTRPTKAEVVNATTASGQ